MEESCSDQLQFQFSSTVHDSHNIRAFVFDLDDFYSIVSVEILNVTVIHIITQSLSQKLRYYIKSDFKDA